ncbi:MAG: DoxX family protein [Marmoricola sp.]|nr:DoxX family protein [Marmoricola sp.]MCW2867396.1 DoxX family protein [Marmoricola sp.]
MTVTRLLARPMLASIFVVGGANAIKNAPALAAAAKPVVDKIRPALDQALPVNVPQDTVTLVRINAAAQLLAGISLARGRAPRLSSSVLAASLVPTTVAGHQFWNETDSAAKAQQRIHFFKNLSLLGGLILAAVDTEGRPGVAWRAQNAGSTVKREAKLLRRQAKVEAKLAAKSVRA